MKKMKSEPQLKSINVLVFLNKMLMFIAAVLMSSGISASSNENDNNFIATKNPRTMFPDNLFDVSQLPVSYITDAPKTIRQGQLQGNNVNHSPEDDPVFVIVFTTAPSLFVNAETKRPSYWARVLAVDTIFKRSAMRKKDAFNNDASNIVNYANERRRLRFRYIDTTTLHRMNGKAMLDDMADILEAEVDPWKKRVVGVIIEQTPSVDMLWAQVAYDTAASLFLPIVVADTRGPIFTPAAAPSGQAEEDCRQFERDLDKELTIPLFTAMPTQAELDNALLKVVFTALKMSRFAIIVIDHDEYCTNSALTSAIEELLNAATLRDQGTRLYRLKGYEFEQGNSIQKWRKAVKEVSVRWRKFVIYSNRPDYEHRFVQTALGLGLAGRGFMYFSLNFDFYLNPLNVRCILEEHTSVMTVRLRKRSIPTSGAGFKKHIDGIDIINDEVDHPFRLLAMKTAVETFNLALNSPVVEHHGEAFRKCTENYHFVEQTFDDERLTWTLDVLKMTPDGYFSRYQYVFANNSINWIRKPRTSFSAAGNVSIETASLKYHATTANENITLLEPVPCQNNRRIRVITIIEPPFIMRKRAEDMKVMVYGNISVADDGHHSGTDEFEGYCIDLLEKMSQELGFSYDLTLVPDGRYGGKLLNGSWDGMIGELERGNADAALAPLTITQARSKVVDFTQSFMTVGIGMLYYNDIEKRSDSPLLGMFSFIRPFKWDVWLATGISLLVYALMHRFICWLSPIEKNSPPNWASVFSTTVKPPVTHSRGHQIWTTGNSVWLAVSAVLQQGCDYFPTSKSTRILYITWSFVSLVLCSCYTANLAAFLTNERLEMPLRRHKDLLNQNKTKYGTLFGGSTHSFFSNSKMDVFQELYSNMAREKSLVAIQAEGIRRVLEGKGKFAFFLESTKLEFEVARDCRLTQIGSLLDNKGYGIATQKGSPLRDLLSTTILKLQKGGRLQALKNKWWIEKNEINKDHCPDKAMFDKRSLDARRSANKLSVEVLGGPFFVLLGGIALGLVISLIEFAVYGLSKAVHKQRRLVNGDMLLKAWKFHIRRVFSVGVTGVVLPVETNKS